MAGPTVRAFKSKEGLAVILVVGSLVLVGPVAMGILTSDDVSGTALEPAVEGVEGLVGAVDDINDLDQSEAERRIHQEVNEERRMRGLPQLERSDELDRIAERHSKDMANNDYLGHEDSQGRLPLDRAPPGCRAGETIFQTHWWSDVRTDGGTVTIDSESKLANHVVSGWMDSDEHRALLLDGRFVLHGIGVAEDGDEVYITQFLCAPS